MKNKELSLLTLLIISIVIISGCTNTSKSGNKQDGFLFLPWNGYLGGEVNEEITLELPFFDFGRNTYSSIEIEPPNFSNLLMKASFTKFNTTDDYIQYGIKMHFRFKKPGKYELKTLNIKIGNEKIENIPIGKIVFDIKPLTVKPKAENKGGTALSQEQISYLYAISLKNSFNQKFTVEGLEFDLPTSVLKKTLQYQHGDFDLGKKWNEWPTSNLELVPTEIKTLGCVVHTKSTNLPQFIQLKPFVKLKDQSGKISLMSGHPTIYSPELSLQQLKDMYKIWHVGPS